MKTLQSWFLVAAAGVAALAFLPTPAAADGALGDYMARVLECERLTAEAYALGGECADGDYIACLEERQARKDAARVCSSLSQ